MFLRAKSFRIFEGNSSAEWDQWNAAGRGDYFLGKRITNVGAHEKNFVAERYLELYPDVNAANKRGGEEWARKHFLRAGLFEIFAGRREDRIGLRTLGAPSVRGSSQFLAETLRSSLRLRELLVVLEMAVVESL